MDKFKETVAVTEGDDGYVATSVHRQYDDGIQYRSVLHFQRSDAAALADAMEQFASTRNDQNLTLADGTLRLFAQQRSAMLNMELTRDPAVPHGGYDTMDLSLDSLPAVIAGLRTRAD